MAGVFEEARGEAGELRMVAEMALLHRARRCLFKNSGITVSAKAHMGNEKACHVGRGGRDATTGWEGAKGDGQRILATVDEHVSHSSMGSRRCLGAEGGAFHPEGGEDVLFHVALVG